MTQYCAFLRGINVGGLKIAMADLRQLMEELGLADVRTVLATGNAVFGAAATPVENPQVYQLLTRLDLEMSASVLTQQSPAASVLSRCIQKPSS